MANNLERDRRRKILQDQLGADYGRVNLYLEKTDHLNERQFADAMTGLFQGKGKESNQSDGRSDKPSPSTGTYGDALQGGVADMFNPARAGVSNEDANRIKQEGDLARADAAALESFQKRMAAERESRQQQQQSQQPQKQRPHWADEWEQMYGKKFDEYGQDPKSMNVADANDEQDMFSPQAGGWRKGWSRLTPEERVMELRYLAPRVEQFEAMRQQLTEQYERMDPVARSHYNDMQKRVMGLEKAYGEKRLNQLEFMRSMEELNGRAQQIKWKYHFRAPGAQPGEITEQNGIQMMRTAKGDLEPISFTPDYIKQNSVALGNGKVAVPLKPGAGYEIMDEATWNPDSLEADKKEFRKIFREQWDESMKAYVSMNGSEPEEEELQKFEKRVRAQTLSIMDSERSAAEELLSRRGKREEASRTGQPVNMSDPLEDEMSAQYEASVKRQQEEIAKYRQGNEQKLSQVQQQQRQAEEMTFRAALKNAGDDPDAQGDAIAKNYDMNPTLKAMANNPVVLRSKQDRAAAQDGRIYMIKDREGNYVRLLKHGGKWFPLPKTD